MGEAITEHFEKYPPELFRYSGLTIYGETKTSFAQEQIDQELSLFGRLKKSELINKPTGAVFALDHNLLIHSPESGRELLALLNTPTEDRKIVGQLVMQVGLLR